MASVIAKESLLSAGADAAAILAACALQLASKKRRRRRVWIVLQTSHSSLLFHYDNVQLNSRLQRQTILPATFSTKFDDVPTDVINLLLCDWMQHATTLYEESKKWKCQFFVV